MAILATVYIVVLDYSQSEIYSWIYTWIDIYVEMAPLTPRPHLSTVQNNHGVDV